MTRPITIFVAAIALVFSTAALARDSIQQHPVADVLTDSEFAPQIDGVTYYFGDSAHPAVTKEFGEFRTNKKTNAFNKSDKEACDWAFRSAILTLHQRALTLGANAVINIRSNYKNNMTKSDTEYTCGAGKFVAGVALIGDFVIVE
ncbi:MAG: hypothetical protein OER91_04945 [Gammaproteobacteria bacterium]|nr:hypothetical protein [Gammaproteobacteria bacterium]